MQNKIDATSAALLFLMASGVIGLTKLTSDNEDGCSMWRCSEPFVSGKEWRSDQEWRGERNWWTRGSMMCMVNQQEGNLP